MENIIKAERVILRPVQESDLEAVHEYAGDNEITMMMFLPNETKEETEKFIRNSIADWKNENPHDREFVIVYEGKVIGGIDLENCGDGTFEIGWIVNKNIAVLESHLKQQVLWLITDSRNWVQKR